MIQSKALANKAIPIGQTKMKITIASGVQKTLKISHFILITSLLYLAGCSHNGITVAIPSENQNSRISMIVIHHTSSNFEDSLNILTQPSPNSVSSHYLIPEPNDNSYSDNKLKVFELVPETQRAWHAGRSYWAGKSGLNDQSIGIEIVNQTYCYQHEPNDPITDNSNESEVPTEPEGFCFYPDFAENQLEIFLELLEDILERHPHIKPTNIVGHSDIAPNRKIDPGPRFPWQRLYQLGFGAWFDDETVTRYWVKFHETPMPIINIQRALNTYGYDIEETGELDRQTRNVLRAFQMHFRPSTVNGRPTLETVAILYALIEKYRTKSLNELLIIDPLMENIPALVSE